LSNCEEDIHKPEITCYIFQDVISHFEHSLTTQLRQKIRKRNTINIVDSKIIIKKFLRNQTSFNPDFAYCANTEKGSLKVKWNNKENKITFELHQIIIMRTDDDDDDEEYPFSYECHNIIVYSHFL